MAKKIKFKKNKKYKVIKAIYKSCMGCVIRYKGIHAGFEGIFHYGEPIPAYCSLGKGWAPSWVCSFFDLVENDPDSFEVVEYTDMVKFCKKLRKKLRKDEV